MQAIAERLRGLKNRMIDHRTIFLPLLQNYYAFMGPEGREIMEKDWDNLLLLDGCRYDVFAELSDLPGRLESCTSKGANTAEFLKKTFEGERYLDTVYVTANPMYATGDYWTDIHVADAFHDIVDVWKTEWDESTGSVWPEAVADAALAAQESYPNKRLLVHFVQPHYPFLGKTGREIPHKTGEESRRAALGESPPALEKQIWRQLRDGEVRKERVLQAYRENLELALPHVEDLLDGLSGKTVVSADHGNHFGERPGPFPFRVYGHPPGVYSPELVTIPWLVHDDCSRKKTVAEPSPASKDRPSEDAAVDRIRSLGYLK